MKKSFGLKFAGFCAPCSLAVVAAVLHARIAFGLGTTAPDDRCLLEERHRGCHRTIFCSMTSELGTSRGETTAFRMILLVFGGSPQGIRVWFRFAYRL
jgi:hypothetical protein